MAVYKVATATIADGEALSEAIQVLEYPRVALEIPTFAAGCSTSTTSVEIEGSSTSTTSAFRSVRYMGVYSAGSGIMTWEVNTSSGNYIAVCEPAAYCRYIRIKLSNQTATAAGLACKVHMYRDPTN